MEQVTTTQVLIEQVLLLSAIEALTDKITRQGYRTQMQTLRLQEAQTQYKKLGGDGYATAIINEAMAASIRHEGE